VNGDVDPGEAARADLQGLQLDLAGVILRIEQAWDEGDSTLGGLLMMRLHTCDAPRLRRYLEPNVGELVDEMLRTGRRVRDLR
jgi:hypothetical protein